MGLSLKRLGSKVFDQVNPFDNGRTYQQRAAVNSRSVFQQATHNGLTNTVGNTLVKPVVQVAPNVSNQIYNRIVAPIGNLPRQDLRVKALNPAVGSVAHFSGATGDIPQTLASVGNAALTIGSAGLAKGVESGVARVLPKVVPKFGAKVIKNATTGAVLNTGFGESSYLGNTPHPTVTGALKVGGQSAALGAALGTGGTLAAPVIKAGAKPVVKLAQSAKSLDQSGKIKLPSFGGQNLSYSSANGITKVSGKRGAVLTKLNQVGAVGKDVSGVGGESDPVIKAIANENKFKDQIQAMRQQAPNDNHFYENTILNNVEKPGDVGNFARHVARRVEGGGENPTNVLDDALQKTNLKAEAAAQQSAHVQELKSMVSNLEKSTGQKGLYSSVLKNMSGMTEKQQLDYLGKSLTSMRDNGVLAMDHLNKEGSFTPQTNKPSTPVSAVGKNVPSEEELQIGKALGMTPKDVAAAKNAHPLETAHPKLSADELANLSPTEQMKISSPNHTPLAPQGLNTAKNPFKSSIPNVKAGDYKQIVSNEQTAANPTLVAGDHWKLAMQKLQETDPESYKNFWRHVEDPKSATTPELQKAIQAWREVDNRIHGTSQTLGGNTNYLTDHGLHPWNLPDELAQHLTNGGDIKRFPGLNSISRKYRTIAEGEANGLQLGDNPLQEGSKYIGASAGSLRRRAIIKGLGEADGHINDKTHYLDLGGGETIPMSKEAHKALRGLQKARYSDNKAAVGLRTTNAALRTTILSGGQFHPINISVLRAGPSLAMAGHPVRAVKGVVGTFTATKGRVGKMYESALTDKVVDPGTGQPLSIVDAAAKIGAPYAQRGYDVEGSALKSGVGHKLVFEQQIPMMHDPVVRSVLDDLVKKGVSLDSEAARQAGIAANSTMGFINKEALNLPTWVRKGMGDWMLASQFTPSKVVTLSKVAKSGVAGKYARSDVASNVIAAAALISGVGYALGQQSDNIRDSILRALINPAIPTPMKDKKGNTVELRTPLTYTGELSKILGLKVKRQADGHLGVDWKPNEALAAHSGLMEWMRSRLAPLQSTAVKLVTNTNFSDKPLYDPKAAAGIKAIQAATTVGQGYLPIGTQGIPDTKFVKDHAPGTVREILDANTPGSNPVLKGVASSAGFSPRTDQTVGKGLETSRYFNAADTALSQAKNTSEKTALQNYLGSKKNPVTGKYDVTPNPNDSGRKAKDLLDAPGTIDILKQMNDSLAKQGSKVDPLWQQSKDKIVATLQYQTMPYGGPDRKHWINQNKNWYTPLSDQRSTFFNSLPKGDPSKPQQPIEYPSPSPQVAAKQKKFFNISDSTERATYLRDNPDVQQQLDKAVEYNNKMRVATLGKGSELDTFPRAAPGVQNIIDAYNKVPKGGGKRGGNKYRAQWIQAHPKEFAAMTSFFTQASLYGLEQDAGQAMFKDTGFSSKGLGDIYNLGNHDIKQGKDKNGKPVYALTTGQSGGTTYTDANGNTFADLGGGSGYNSSSGYGQKDKTAGSAYKYALALNAGGKVKRPKVTAHLSSAPKSKVAAASKPKVSLKKSKV